MISLESQSKVQGDTNYKRRRRRTRVLAKLIRCRVIRSQCALLDKTINDVYTDTIHPHTPSCVLVIIIIRCFPSHQITIIIILKKSVRALLSYAFYTSFFSCSITKRIRVDIRREDSRRRAHTASREYCIVIEHHIIRCESHGLRRRRVSSFKLEMLIQCIVEYRVSRRGSLFF